MARKRVVTESQAVPAAVGRNGHHLYDAAEAAEHLSAADRKLAEIIRRVGPCTLTPPPRTTPFQSLLKAIVYQQLSGKAAGTIHGRVAALLPKAARDQPAALIELSDEALRGAGLSGAKQLAVKDLAAKTLEGVVPSAAALRKLSDQEIIDRLTTIRGIGVWSVEMLLIFYLRRPDVLPVHDLGVRKGLMLTCGWPEMPTPQKVLAHGDRWRPFRSVASWYLWRAVDLHGRRGAEPFPP